MWGDAQWQALASSSPLVSWLAYLSWHVYWWSGWIAIESENDAKNDQDPAPGWMDGSGVAGGGCRYSSTNWIPTVRFTTDRNVPSKTSPRAAISDSVIRGPQ